MMFPLNGEYTRFGTFNETVRFSAEGGTKRITLRTVIRDYLDFPSFYEERYLADLRMEPQGYLDWSIDLVGGRSPDSGSATLDSITYQGFLEHEGNRGNKVFAYELNRISDIGADDERRQYPVLSHDQRRYPGELFLTAEGSYYEESRRDGQPRVRPSHAIRLQNALPDAVYECVSFGQAIGRSWWNSASDVVAFDEHGDEHSESDVDEAGGAELNKDGNLAMLVEMAREITVRMEEGWQDRESSSRSSLSFGMRLDNLVHDQIWSSQDEDFRRRVHKAMASVPFEEFMAELEKKLEGHAWAAGKVWDPVESTYPGLNPWHGENIRWFFGNKIKYLGPLRKAPQVLYDPRPFDLDLGLNGEYTAAVLHSYSSHKVLPIRNAVGEERVSLQSEVNYWLRKFELAQRADLKDRGRLGIDLKIVPMNMDRQIDLTSVGVGVSQVLPVIVLCVLAEPGDLVMLEQPELHLHPKLQHDLGDFLLQCSRSGRQLVVETHSEHLVNRVRRRVSEKTGWAEGMVAVIFSEQDSEGVSTFRPSTIDSFGGDESEWPEGFFDIAGKEAQEFVATSLAKQQRARG